MSQRGSSEFFYIRRITSRTTNGIWIKSEIHNPTTNLDVVCNPPMIQPKHDRSDLSALKWKILFRDLVGVTCDLVNF